MIRLVGVAWSGGAGVTAEVTARWQRSDPSINPRPPAITAPRNPGWLNLCTAGLCTAVQGLGCHRGVGHGFGSVLAGGSYIYGYFLAQHRER